MAVGNPYSGDALERLYLRDNTCLAAAASLCALVCVTVVPVACRLQSYHQLAAYLPLALLPLVALALSSVRRRISARLGVSAL